MIAAREMPDWYRGFQRWDGENVVAVRPLLRSLRDPDAPGDEE
jgi:hypothetical protein